MRPDNFRDTMERKLILASRSPRRKLLLKKLGLKFATCSPNVSEFVSSPLPARKLVEKLAERKAQYVASRLARGIVIGADTLVVLGNLKLGKPRDRRHAVQMLKRISGKKLAVYSGVAIIDSKSGKKAIFSEKTLVWMRKIGDDEIAEYVKTKEPLGKAGAFAIQGKGEKLISKIEGSRSNVIGLPLEKLRSNLKRFLRAP